MFKNAAEGSVYQRLLQNNMDNNSFTKYAEGLRSLMVNPKETRLYNVQTILSDDMYKCKVCINTSKLCFKCYTYMYGWSLLQFRSCLFGQLHGQCGLLHLQFKKDHLIKSL
jgi:hypothetical protein